MLKDSYVSKLKTLPKDAIKIKVDYPSIFSPSEELLSDFNESRWKLMKEGIKKAVARKVAWEKTNFKNRYIKEIRSKPKIMDKLKEIKKLAEKKDVYLYCYCGESLCPRFILIDIINKL